MMARNCLLFTLKMRRYVKGQTQELYCVQTCVFVRDYDKKWNTHPLTCCKVNCLGAFVSLGEGTRRTKSAYVF